MKKIGPISLFVTILCSGYGLERSTVFTLHAPHTPEEIASVLSEYQVDVIGWGSAAEQNLAAIKALGIEYHMTLSGSVWGGASLDDPTSPQGRLVCESFDGTRIRTRGTGFTTTLYRMCGNKPGWADEWLARNAASGSFDGYQLDAPIGSGGHYGAFLVDGACYCDPCIEKFREYLKNEYSAEELAAQGVVDIEAYNQRDIVNAALKGRTFADAFKADDIKFGKDYLWFQMRTGIRTGTRMLEIIRENDPDGVLKANAWHLAPYNLYTADLVDYFFVENHYYAGEWRKRSMSKGVSKLFKLADSTGTSCVSIPTIDDFKILRENGFRNVNEQKLWIAGSYALGGYCVAPVRYEWAGTPFYEPDPALFSPIYKFIKEHKFLFDGFESYDEGIALIYDNAAYFETFGEIDLGSDAYQEAFDEINAALWDANIQYALVTAGDKYFYTHRLTGQELDRHGIVFNSSESWLVEGQSEVVSEFEDAGVVRTIAGPEGIEAVLQDYAPAVSVGNAPVWAVVRKHGESSETVIHLLNQQHNHETDELTGVDEVNLSVRKDVLGAGRVDQVAVYALGKAMVQPEYSFDEDGLNISIEDVDLWSIVHVTMAPLDYSHWSADFELNGSAEDDPDGDGQINLVEYGFGGDPTNGWDAGVLPVLRYDGMGERLKLMHVSRQNAEAGIVYKVEQTEDLKNGVWTTGDWNSVTSTATSDPNFELVEYTFPAASAGNRFFRIRISLL